jgi:DNA-binding transcriptional regulator YhcF (GntR family)
MRRISAYEVRDTIIDRMVNELYPVGTKLPTARELASEFGVHRNTVAKAYGLLSELGLVVSRQGRGTFAVSVPDQHLQPGLTQQFHDGLRDSIRTSRRLGVQESELRQLLDQAIAEIYDQPTALGVFIECNYSDLRGGIAEIEKATQVRLDGVLLDEFEHNPQEIADKYNAVFTNLIHVKEVNDRLSHVENAPRIIGIHTVPDEDALVQIAEIPPSSTVGIVVDSPEGAHRFTNQIMACNSVDIEVEL